mgnify:CR=1 FL=1
MGVRWAKDGASNYAMTAMQFPDLGYSALITDTG